MRQSRRKRWNDAVAVMMTIQAECAAWFEALPESPRDSETAEALQEMVDLDLDTIAASPRRPGSSMAAAPGRAKWWVRQHKPHTQKFGYSGLPLSGQAGRPPDGCPKTTP